MQEFRSVTGMIIRSTPIGEYDRRVVILTKDNGKISAFAKGARRPNSKFIASTDLFSFGEFKLYVGRESYNIQEANISNYFENIRGDLAKSLYGMFFLEVCDYNTRENNDEYYVLRLLYSSVKALGTGNVGNDLIKLIFEIKLYTLLGQFAITDRHKSIYKEATIYTLEYIYNTKPEKLYSFKLSDDIYKEVSEIAAEYRKKVMPHIFKSEEMISVIG